MNAIRTLVAEDQPVARERLLTLLHEEPDVQVVGECADGREAVTAIQRLSPDLVFLDMQMPELDGLGVVDALIGASGTDRLPVIIFVTAYSEYAVRAFDVRALDYLLKPFGRERFRRALARAREHLDRRDAEHLGRRLVDLLKDREEKRTNPDRVIVKSAGRVLFLDPERIDWVEAEGNYVRLHVGDDSHLLRETMAAIEARLGADAFVRLHRCYLARLDRIVELQTSGSGEMEAVLRDGTRLRIGRSYRDSVEARLRQA